MLLKTKYDLDNAREQYGKLVDKQARKVLVCAGTGCVAGGSLNIYQKLIETISAKGLECVVALADEPHDDDAVSYTHLPLIESLMLSLKSPTLPN